MNKKQATMRCSIVIPAKMWQSCRSWVLHDVKHENHAFIFCRTERQKNAIKLTGAQLRLTEREELENQSSIEVRLKRQYVIKILEYARKNELSILDIHSHPFAKHAHFSGTDDKYGKDDAQWLAKKIEEGVFPSIEWGMIVVGQTSDQARIWDRTHCEFVDVANIEQPSDEEESELYDRQLRLWGEQGQQSLANTKVAVVGCGGIGSVVAEELARVGVGHILLIDNDLVEESNLPRLIGVAEHQIGKPKVEAITQSLKQSRPNLIIKALKDTLNRENMNVIAGYDFIFGCVDNDGARKLLNKSSLSYGIPFMDVATGIIADTKKRKVERMGGQIRFIDPGVTPCLQCYNGAIDPMEAAVALMSETERTARIRMGYVEGTALSPEAAVLPLNAILASLAVGEFTKWVTKFDRPKIFLHFDALEMKLVIEPCEMKRVSSCPACGPGGYLAKENQTSTKEEPSIKIDQQMQAVIDAFHKNYKAPRTDIPKADGS